ncbi:MAG: penicillin-binding transpeptidase domain-containing protein, partial [Chloroflexota bacterium]
MKPFTYAAAMELGMTAGDVIWDTPVSVPQPGQPAYEPVNYDRSFHGPMTIRRALANSYNIPAVQAVRMTGVDYLLGMMDRVGVSTLDDPSRYGISLTLGGGEVSLLELTNAYGVFANVGTYVPPTSILCVVDNNDNIVYQYEGGCPEGVGNFTTNTVDRSGLNVEEEVLDPRIAYTMTDIMSDNSARSIEMGSNSPLYTPSIGTAVKTGTTNDIKDNWTIGYTRNVVVGVWVGNNNGDPMVNSSGLTGAAPIWNSVMTSIYTQPGVLDAFAVDGQIMQDIPNAPAGMSRTQICDVRAVTIGATGCPRTINEWLLNSPALVPDANGNMISLM